MTSGRKLLLIVLAVTVLIGGYYALSRMTGVVPWFGRSDRAAEAQGSTAEDQAAAERRKAIAEARRRDLQKMLEQIPEDLKKPRTLTLNDFVTSQERFPLPDDATLLTAAPPLPEKMPPLVFIAPLRNLEDKRTRPAETLEFLITIHLAASPPGRILLDLLPDTLRREVCQPKVGAGTWSERAPGEYLEIARSLGSDTFVYGRADVVDGHAMIQLGLSDLRSTRTDTFTGRAALADLGPLIGRAVEKIALFSGVTASDIQSAGMIRGLPGAATYELTVSDEVATPELFRKYLALEPDSLSLHYQAPLFLPAPDSIELANESLQRWPDNTLLLKAKQTALGYMGSMPAQMLFVSEAVRRGDCRAGTMQRLMGVCYDLMKMPQLDISETARAVRAVFEQYLQKRPDMWLMRRYYALHLWNMAYHLPFSLSSDSNDTSGIRSLQEQTYALAFQQLEQAAAGREPPVLILLDMLRLKRTMGEPPESLMPILARIQLIDPKNIKGDLLVATYKARKSPVGDMAYFDLIKKAVDRAGNTPDVMDAVTQAMAEPLGVIIGRAESDDYERLKDRPDALFYGEAMETALSDGRLVSIEQLSTFFYVIKANNGWVPKWKIYVAYLERNHAAMEKALREGNWEEALRLGGALAYFADENGQHKAQYAVVKSLWKLRRYAEALKWCEIYQKNFPERHTFYYMFAVVAEEAGVRLEEAYEKAKIATRLDPTNQGIKDLLARLGKRLGKPTTL